MNRKINIRPREHKGLHSKTTLLQGTSPSASLSDTFGFLQESLSFLITSDSFSS